LEREGGKFFCPKMQNEFINISADIKRGNTVDTKTAPQFSIIILVLKRQEFPKVE
jgi:hypothetical protein